MSASDPRPNPPALVRVWVAGAAKTKGSLSAQVAPGVTASGRRRVRMVESVVGSGAWRAATVQAVMAALGGAPSPDGPRLPCRPWDRAVAVALCLWLPRPASVPADSWPTSRRTGDVDKLQRNIGDALVDVGLVADDSLIVTWRETKLWAPSPMQAGALIVVQPAGPPVAPEWTRVDT
jgi:hypothetical protein